MKTCEQVKDTRLFDKLLFGLYQKRGLARRFYSRSYQGEQTRHKFRIKRMKHTPRLNKLKSGICPKTPF
jgi:hypothetical protein